MLRYVLILLDPFKLGIVKEGDDDAQAIMLLDSGQIIIRGELDTREEGEHKQYITSGMHQTALIFLAIVAQHDIDDVCML
jgi:hypothetical protein